jgi:hypothetical protein
VACSRIEHIPNQKDDSPKQFYQFPSQFNTFGQRTNSGVSIVDWEDDSLQLETGAGHWWKAWSLMEIAARPSMSSSWMKKKERISVSRLMEKLFCMLVLPLHDSCWIRKSLSNDKYRDSKACFRPYCHASWNIRQAKRHSLVTQGCLWSSLCYSSTSQGWRTADESVVVSIVFFTGKLEKLLYLTSHLFLAFLLPNYIKSCVWKKPWLFEVVKTVVRWVVSLLNGIT